MIPNFDDDRINFVRIIKENKDIFDELLESGRYNFTSNSYEVRKNFNENYIYQGYHFFKNFSLDDDANRYALTDDLDDFNTEGETDVQTIIHEFERWLHRDIVEQIFKKKYDEKLQREEKRIKLLHKKSLNQIDEILAKKRTMKRTSQVKEEMSNIDYVPEDREKSVKGSEYRAAKNRFTQQATSQRGGKRKTKTQKRGGKRKTKTQKNRS